MKIIKNFLWTLPFLSFLFGYLLLYMLFSPDVIQTPAIVGKSLQDAMCILSEHNLNPRILKEKIDNDLPNGIILSQSPSKGQTIRHNQSVYLVISKKSPKPIAPQLYDKSLEQIKKKLAKQEIGFRIYYLKSASPKDTCIGQLPEPNDIIEHKMMLFLSKGNNQRVLLPNFKNKPVMKVIDFLSEHNIQPQLVHTHGIDANHTCNNCIIMNQKPLAGSIIDLEKSITIQLHVN